MSEDIRKVLAYVWDLKKKKIDKIEDEARHPYAKAHDKVEHNRMVGKKWVFPWTKKGV